ncbi:predicted protein [Streptomyces sp. C]|nr:predicted protein [Streptomyces sp. C]
MSTRPAPGHGSESSRSRLSQVQQGRGVPRRQPDRPAGLGCGRRYRHRPPARPARPPQRRIDARRTGRGPPKAGRSGGLTGRLTPACLAQVATWAPSKTDSCVKGLAHTCHNGVGASHLVRGVKGLAAGAVRGLNRVRPAARSPAAGAGHLLAFRRPLAGSNCWASRC